MIDRSRPLSIRMRRTLPPIMQVMKELGSGSEYYLTQGVPFFSPPEEAVRNTFRKAADLNRYGPDGGDPELKEEVSGKLKMENGMDRDPQNEIMITSGANSAFVNAAAAVCDPGDEMVLLSPYYFNHFMTLDMLGVRQRICPLGEGLVPDLDRVRSCIGPRTRAVVAVSPNNPAGVSYSRRSIEGLVEICRDSGIWLISDETYDRFVYGTEHVSPGSIKGPLSVISLFSFSKVFGMSGWRVGYMAYPGELHESLLKVQDTTVICPSRASQRLAYLCLRDHPDHIEGYIGELDRSRRMLVEWSGSKESIRGPHPDGAFYFFFEYHGDRAYRDSMDLAREIYGMTGVLLVPGDPFGASDPPSLRISYGNTDPSTLERALERLDGFFD